MQIVSLNQARLNAYRFQNASRVAIPSFSAGNSEQRPRRASFLNHSLLLGALGVLFVEHTVIPAGLNAIGKFNEWRRTPAVIVERDVPAPVRVTRSEELPISSGLVPLPKPDPTERSSSSSNRTPGSSAANLQLPPSSSRPSDKRSVVKKTEATVPSVKRPTTKPPTPLKTAAGPSKKTKS